jgi:hypothetical protein
MTTGFLDFRATWTTILNEAQGPYEIGRLSIHRQQARPSRFHNRFCVRHEWCRRPNKEIPRLPDRTSRHPAKEAHLNAQTLLGILYDRGEGVRADAERAMQWYLLAAEGGSNIAQTNLALGFRDGKGVPQNYGKAGLWLWISAENGSEIGLKWLENAQTNMSPEQFAEGQLRVRACIESFYKDCD